MLNDYWKGLKKARIRIFYSEIADAGIYRLLLNALLPHTYGFDGIYGFVPLEDKNTLEIFRELDFITERYSYLFVNDDIQFRENKLPQGYVIRPLEPGRDEQAWCDVRNAAFRTLKGNEAPITAGMLKLTMEARDHLEGGLMLLCHGDKPVGVIRGADDEYNGMRVLNVGAVAVVPEYRGYGLGKCLLRVALNFALERSYTKAILSVNTDNETAKLLYLKEGFRQAEGFAGLKYDLKRVLLSLIR
jgi:mycothiol synthase